MKVILNALCHLGITRIYTYFWQIKYVINAVEAPCVYFKKSLNHHIEWDNLKQKPQRQAPLLIGSMIQIPSWRNRLKRHSLKQFLQTLRRLSLKLSLTTSCMKKYILYRVYDKTSLLNSLDVKMSDNLILCHL